MLLHAQRQCLNSPQHKPGIERGKNRAGVRSAESSAAAAGFDRDTAHLTLVSGVATSYFEVLALRARLAIARDNLDIAQRVLDVVSARGVAVLPGKHRVSVERDGYLPWDKIVEASDRPLVFDVALERVPD